MHGESCIYYTLLHITDRVQQKKNFTRCVKFEQPHGLKIVNQLGGLGGFHFFFCCCFFWALLEIWDYLRYWKSFARYWSGKDTRTHTRTTKDTRTLCETSSNSFEREPCSRIATKTSEIFFISFFVQHSWLLKNSTYPFVVSTIECQLACLIQCLNLMHQI